MNRQNVTLINTIGNRDLQFNPQIIENNPDIKDWFVRNNDDPEKIVINTRNEQKTFYEISKYLYENFDKFNAYAVFPMIQKSIDYLKQNNQNINTIVLVCSKQNPPDKQDTYYIAGFIKRLIKKHNVELEYICFPPNQLKPLIFFFQGLYNKCNNVYVNNSGGTPQMRTASLLANAFLTENKVQALLTVNARTSRIDTENAQAFINTIYKHTIEQMLKVYDYAGILNLPVSNEIKEISKKALEEYNFNIEYFPTTKKNQPKEPYDKRVLKAINVLLENLRVTYIQNRYAEALQRIFRLEEAIWYLLFYSLLKEEKYINDTNPNKVVYNNRKKKIEDIFNFGSIVFISFTVPLINEISKKLLKKEIITKNENEKYVIVFSNEEKPINGKNLYYFLFKMLNKYNDITSLFAELNKDEEGNAYTQNSKLNSLRNKSFLGHGFNGVTKEDMDNLLSMPLNEFVEKIYKSLSNYYPIENYQTPIFEKYNRKITSLLN